MVTLQRKLLQSWLEMCPCFPVLLHGGGVKQMATKQNTQTDVGGDLHTL